MILFLDACALIYRVEEVAPWNQRLAKLLATYRRKHADLSLAISRLSRLECRVQPVREGNAELLARYETLFSAPDLHTVEIDANVIEGATQIRARFGLRTPDAIQAASCLALDAKHVFLTNDRSFARVPGLSLASL
jgi:predicted nucleic acid-binding protein